MQTFIVDIDGVKLDVVRDDDGKFIIPDRWRGIGSALKPAMELICLARKPLEHGLSIASNVLKWGTGALNIDGCRVEYEDTQDPASNPLYRVQNGYATAVGSDTGGANISIKPNGGNVTAHAKGRWPANVLHDGSEEVVAAFPETSSGELLPHHKKSGAGLSGTSTFAIRDRTGEAAAVYGDEGSAARFFYTAKADAGDRLGSRHPTVKPVDLMQWLIRLVTPKNGLVLDPFAGTGTTAEAAFREGMRSVMCEREVDYQADIRRRMGLVLGGADERRWASLKAKGDVEDHPGPLFG